MLSLKSQDDLLPHPDDLDARESIAEGAASAGCASRLSRQAKTKAAADADLRVEQEAETMVSASSELRRGEAWLALDLAASA